MQAAVLRFNTKSGFKIYGCFYELLYCLSVFYENNILFFGFIQNIIKFGVCV